MQAIHLIRFIVHTHEVNKYQRNVCNNVFCFVTKYQRLIYTRRTYKKKERKKVKKMKQYGGDGFYCHYF